MTVEEGRAPAAGWLWLAEGGAERSPKGGVNRPKAGEVEARRAEWSRPEAGEIEPRRGEMLGAEGPKPRS